MATPVCWRKIMSKKFSFEIEKSSGAARTGKVYTKHGVIRTPAFMPVGTAATVKAMLPESVKETGADIILGNTYHLMLRPTAERINNLGGLHKFMNWQGPILTDSGGFQVMSLSKIRKLTKDGVEFQSHIDGSRHMLTPERSMEIQNLLGSDITMIFDECTPYPATHKQAAESMRLSLDWALRSKNAYEERDGYGLFGIVQGSTYRDLREESSAKLQEIGFDGYAIGGLAVGEGQELMFSTLDYTVPTMPVDRPRYLMGVGKPSDIVGAVLRGVDMFDCVLPTRSGRNGQAFTRNGAVNITNAKNVDDDSPLDAECKCPACSKYSRAYLNHLVKSKEILGSMLMTWHNLQYYQDLMSSLRDAIKNDYLQKIVDDFYSKYEADSL